MTVADVFFSLFVSRFISVEHVRETQVKKRKFIRTFNRLFVFIERN